MTDTKTNTSLQKCTDRKQTQTNSENRGHRDKGLSSTEHCHQQGNNNRTGRANDSHRLQSAPCIFIGQDAVTVLEPR